MSRPLVVDPIQDPLVAARASRTVRWYVPPADSATRAPEWRPIERAGEAGESAQAPAMPEEPPPETGLSLDEIDLATFAARARAAGRRDGLAAAAEHTERRLADALDALAAQLAAMERAADENLAVCRGQLATLLRAAITAFAADPPPGWAEARATAFVEACLDQLVDTRELIIELAEETAPALEEKLQSLVAAHGLATRPVIQADPALAPGYVRARWRDGWAELDPSRIERQVSNALHHLNGGSGPRAAAIDAGPAPARDRTSDDPPPDDTSEAPTQHDFDQEPKR